MLIGGAYSSGAPKGNKNGWKRGMRSKEYLDEKRRWKSISKAEKKMVFKLIGIQRGNGGI